MGVYVRRSIVHEHGHGGLVPSSFGSLIQLPQLPAIGDGVAKVIWQRHTVGVAHSYDVTAGHASQYRVRARRRKLHAHRALQYLQIQLQPNLCRSRQPRRHTHTNHARRERMAVEHRPTPASGLQVRRACPRCGRAPTPAHVSMYTSEPAPVHTTPASAHSKQAIADTSVDHKNVGALCRMTAPLSMFRY